MRLDMAIDGYWLAREREFSPNTVNEYRTTFERFLNFVGHEKEVSTIQAADVNAFLNYCKESLNLGRKSRSNVWTALSSFYTWASTELDIPHIMRKGVPRPTVHREPVEPFTHDEIRRLLDACRYTNDWYGRRGTLTRSSRPTELRDRAIVLTFLDTGMRVSELAALTLSDYNPKNGQILIRHGKGNKRRVVFLGRTARKALWRYLAERPDAKPNEGIFINSKENRPLHRRGITYLINRLGQRAGVHAFPHKFRHTFAINFLRNGGNPLELQRLLGHSRMETVTIYASLAAVDLENAMKTASPADNWRL